MSQRTGFLSLVLIGLFAFTLVFTLPYNPTQAQPRATLEARSQSIQQTAQAAALTIEQTAQAASLAIQNRASGVQQTIEAGAQSMSGTIQVGADELRGTIEASLPGIQSTAQYVGTAIHQQVGDIQATVTAISATIQAAVAELPEDVQELLGYLGEQTSLSYDPATRLLTVTSFVTEAQANELQDIVVEAAGYNPQAVSLDTRDDGTILVTMIDVSGELSGNVGLTYQITVVDGRAKATLTNVTINGANAPAERIPANLLSALELGLLSSAMHTVVNVPAGVPFDYTVQSINVSDTGILIVYEVILA